MTVRLLLNPIFLINNPIQIHHKYVIDNPNPIFKMDWQSNPNPISIQLFLKKDKGQQILNGQVLWWLYWREVGRRVYSYGHYAPVEIEAVAIHAQMKMLDSQQYP